MKLKAENREDRGRMGCHRLQLQGKYPAVLYGQSNTARMLQLDKGVMDVFMKTHPVKTQIFSIEVGQVSQEVLVKEIKRSTVTNRIQHIDFYEVTKNKEIQVNIPVLFQNEETSVGVKEGGLIDHVMTEIGIKVLPRNLPENLSVDIAALEVGQVIHLSELELPKGVSLQRPVDGDYNPIIVSIHASKVAEETDLPVSEETVEEVETLNNDSQRDTDE